MTLSAQPSRVGSSPTAPSTRTIDNAIHIRANHFTLGTLGTLGRSKDQPDLAVITTSSNLNAHGIFFELTAPMLRDFAAEMLRLSDILDDTAGLR